MQNFKYESMGTGWEITLWDDISPKKWDRITKKILRQSKKFDQTYSRFIESSLIWKIANKPGKHKVPEDLVKMLHLYNELYHLSEKKLNPLVGFTISDMGYDATYSLKPKRSIHPVPEMDDALKILAKNRIQTTKKILIDLGALGKGYFIDLIADDLAKQGFQRFMVNGGGDIRYQGDEPIKVGLEHPTDKTKVIGSLTMHTGALCASGTDRRSWGNYHHVIDPQKLSSPKEILSTWVIAENAALADGLATCLFMTPPENYTGRFQFEYAIVNQEMRVKTSTGFAAHLF